jgi:PadR family transcriptional regulator, regulatory protein PadR
MPSEKTDLLQGTLDMLILKIAALGPIHGYAISQRMQQISRDVLQVQQGSLYPALHRLKKRGWLRAEWRASECGRDAKFYSLTKAGRKQLDTETAQWERLAEAIGLNFADSGIEWVADHKERWSNPREICEWRG